MLTAGGVIEMKESHLDLSSRLRIVAHEFGHALHEESMEGRWSASNCDGHEPGKASSYSCAMQEGLADYLIPASDDTFQRLMFVGFESAWVVQG